MKNIIREKLIAQLSPLKLEVVDESHKHAGHSGARPGGNTHFHIMIISEAFTALSRIDRHKMVYDILKEELESTIHALSLTLKSPNELP